MRSQWSTDKIGTLLCKSFTACWEKTGLRKAELGLPLRQLPKPRNHAAGPLPWCSKSKSLVHPSLLRSSSFPQHQPLTGRASHPSELSVTCLSVSLKATLAWPRRCRVSPGKDVLPLSPISQWEVLLSHRLPPWVDWSDGGISTPALQAGTGCARSSTQRAKSCTRSSASGLFLLSHLSVFCFRRALTPLFYPGLGESSALGFLSPSKWLKACLGNLWVKWLFRFKPFIVCHFSGPAILQQSSTSVISRHISAFVTSSEPSCLAELLR